MMNTKTWRALFALAVILPFILVFLATLEISLLPFLHDVFAVSSLPENIIVNILYFCAPSMVILWAIAKTPKAKAASIAFCVFLLFPLSQIFAFLWGFLTGSFHV